MAQVGGPTSYRAELAAKAEAVETASTGLRDETTEFLSAAQKYIGQQTDRAQYEAAVAKVIAVFRAAQKISENLSAN